MLHRSAYLLRNSTHGMEVSPLFSASSKASYTKIYCSCGLNNNNNKLLSQLSGWTGPVEAYMLGTCITLWSDETAEAAVRNGAIANLCLNHIDTFRPHLLDTAVDVNLTLHLGLVQQVIQCYEGACSSNTSTAIGEWHFCSFLWISLHFPW